jgi:hypothetical protein
MSFVHNVKNAIREWGSRYRTNRADTGGAAPATPLGAGVYTQPGIVSAPPTTGQGWVLGVPALSSSADISVLVVLAPAAKTGANFNNTWKGDLSMSTGRYHNGAAYVNLAGWIASLPPTHAAYTAEAFSCAWTSQSAGAFLFNFSESVFSVGSGMQSNSAALT